MNIKQLIKRLEQIEEKERGYLGGLIQEIKIKIIDRKDGGRYHVCKEIIIKDTGPDHSETVTDYFLNANE